MSDKLNEEPRQVSIVMPAWIDDLWREKAPIRQRNDIKKWFMKTILEKYGPELVVNKTIIDATVELRLLREKESPYKRKEGYKNIVQFDLNGLPSCELHGAMNCVSKNRKLWRCIMCGIGVSFGSVNAFDKWLTSHEKVSE
jgi:hypothetical protein